MNKCCTKKHLLSLTIFVHCKFCNCSLKNIYYVTNYFYIQHNLQTEIYLIVFIIYLSDLFDDCSYFVYLFSYNCNQNNLINKKVLNYE